MKHFFLTISALVISLCIGTELASANHSAKAPGLFFPYSRNASIDTAMPTIMGKLSQKQSIKLPTSFDMESPALRGDPYYYLQFATGKVQGITASIDGKQIVDVMGFPQYPRILCHDPHKDAGTLPSEATCMKKKKSALPPVIFFFKPTAPLSEGKHTAQIAYDGRKMKMNFYIVSHAYLDAQTVPAGNEFSLDSKENCARGRFHDALYLNVPLPLSSNKKVMYYVSFPTEENEKGELKEVRIRINGIEYNLFFPNSKTFFSGKTRKGTRVKVKDERSLFLPVENLYFADGRNAMVWESRDSASLPLTEYFELIPFDASGRKYLDHAMPRTTTSAASCVTQ